MSRYKEGEVRAQMKINSLEEQIEQYSVVRFIDIFVSKLDMITLGFRYSETKETGNRPYSPRDLMKLYIYGYFYGIRSSRKLEMETNRNIEVKWLICELAPDFKTISDFRKDNIDAIKEVFKTFTNICREQGLIGGSTVAIDGTKVKAVNSPDKVWTKSTVKKDKKYIEEKIAKYIKDLEESEKSDEENIGSTKEIIKKAIEKLEEKKKQLIKIEKKIEATGEQVAKTDEDCRLMKTRKGFDACYNVQTVVDSKNKLIVTYEVTNDVNDSNQLEPMVKKTQEEIGKEEIEILVDRGYVNTEQIENVEGSGAIVYIPEKETRPGEIEFKYNKETDIYICSEGKMLKYESSFKSNGKEVKRYKCKDCSNCSRREECTSSKTGRTIKVLKNQEIIDRVVRRVKKNPDKMKQRSKTCEHTFGIMKQNMGFRYFLMKSLQKVKVETGLTMLAFNIKRVINILKKQGLERNMLLIEGN